MKRKIILILILSISLLVGCSKDNKILIDPSSNNNVLEELGFSKASYFGSKIEMWNNKNEVVANYIEIMDKDGILEGYIISDYLTGKVHEYALGESLLFDLILKANLDIEIVENNPIYYAGPFSIIVTDDNGNLYHLMWSEDNIAELISKEDLDNIFND